MQGADCAPEPVFDPVRGQTVFLSGTECEPATRAGQGKDIPWKRRQNLVPPLQ